MSLRAIFDLTLTADNFRNVGMYNQGIYYLQYKIYYILNDVKYFATPYSNVPLTDSKPPKPGFHNLRPGETQHFPPHFRTRCFYIRFKDETVNLNEICQFRAEMDAEFSHEFTQTEYFLEVSLKFKKVRYAGSKQIQEGM
jgi:hypothetical protein